MNECIFCKMSQGQIEVNIIYENDNFFSIPDAHPKTEGHSLVISKKHFENTLDMPESLGSELLDCIKKTATNLMEKNNAEGFNVVANNFGVAGQAINHLHFHILPRKKGDGISVIG